MREWDDNEYPLAYLMTFRTYGSWLHGDKRGSIDRYNNAFRSPYKSSNLVVENQQKRKLKSNPVLLDAAQRTVVQEAVKDVCTFRAWHLHCINVRTNHIHSVIAAAKPPDHILRDLKAYSTRALRSAGLWTPGHTPWSDSGSYRYLWKEDSVWYACDYVLNGQGDDLPEFK
jgi:REP element-mobilizing transposase RayT